MLRLSIDAAAAHKGEDVVQAVQVRANQAPRPLSPLIRNLVLCVVAQKQPGFKPVKLLMNCHWRLLQNWTAKECAYNWRTNFHVIRLGFGKRH